MGTYQSVGKLHCRCFPTSEARFGRKISKLASQLAKTSNCVRNFLPLAGKLAQLLRASFSHVKMSFFAVVLQVFVPLSLSCRSILATSQGV